MDKSKQKQPPSMTDELNKMRGSFLKRSQINKQKCYECAFNSTALIEAKKQNNTQRTLSFFLSHSYQMLSPVLLCEVKPL